MNDLVQLIGSREEFDRDQLNKVICVLLAKTERLVNRSLKDESVKKRSTGFIQSAAAY